MNLGETMQSVIDRRLLDIFQWGYVKLSGSHNVALVIQH